MTKDEIKKALLYCQDYDCDSCVDCPYAKSKRTGMCKDLLHSDALDLITEQEKEIEQLKTEGEDKIWSAQTVRAYINGYKDGHDSACEKKSEIIGQLNAAYNKALERLKSNCQEIGELKAQVKQAKIDVLNELKGKCHNYYPSIDHYCCSVKAVNLSDINDMIEELKK